MKKILKTFYSNSVLFSLLLTISAFFVSFALSGFAIRAHTDDLLVSVNIHNGYYDTIFINWFLSAVLIPIQKVFPGLNVFVLFQFIFNSLSFFVIIYAIMNSKKANFTIKISIALFFAIIKYSGLLLRRLLAPQVLFYFLLLSHKVQKEEY